jgi:hypothetical protein
VKTELSLEGGLILVGLFVVAESIRGAAVGDAVVPVETLV